MLLFLKRLFRSVKSKGDRKTFIRAISIDASSPEFHDLYPTLVNIADRLRSAGIFHENAVTWIAQTAQTSIKAGAGLRKSVRVIVTAGRPLEKPELKALGLHHARNVGTDFVAALQGVAPTTAINQLEIILHTATSHANHLHSLRRFDEAGITHCYLSSPHDERETAIERKYDQRLLTIQEARLLAVEHQTEIRRSAFMAIVEF